MHTNENRDEIKKEKRMKCIESKVKRDQMCKMTENESTQQQTSMHS